MMLSGIKTIEIEKGSSWSGERTDLALHEYLSKVLDDVELSRTVVSKFIPTGVYVDGKNVKPSYRLRVGDQVKIDLDGLNAYITGKGQEEKLEIAPVKGNLEIIDECDDWIVINKQSGVAVHPSVGNENNTLANFVKHYLISKGEYDENIDRAGVVHRLDKPVSGLILFAKNKNFQTYIMGQFQEKLVVKRYLAAVTAISGKKNDNIWAEGEEKLMEGYIRRDPGNRLRRLFNPTGGGKFAASRVKSVGEDLFEVEIFTGRTHQIRATLRYLGFVVNGDQLYGSSKEMDVEGKIDLKCIFLQFKDQQGIEHSFNLSI